MLSERVLRTGIKPAPYQKSFELVVGTDTRVENFQAANKQFSFLTISLGTTEVISKEVSMIVIIQHLQVQK